MVVARIVGINHVALEVGDVEQALSWYGRFFDFELRGRVGDAMAFIDMGDQFIAVAAARASPASFSTSTPCAHLPIGLAGARPG